MCNYVYYILYMYLIVFTIARSSKYTRRVNILRVGEIQTLLPEGRELVEDALLGMYQLDSVGISLLWPLWVCNILTNKRINHAGMHFGEYL